MAFDSTYAVARIIEESTYGVTPASAMQILNVKSADMTRVRSLGRPGILTGDRRSYPNVILQEDGTVTLPTVLQWKNMLLAQEGILASDIATAFTETQTDISCTSSTGVYESAALGDFSSLQVGDWVYVSGFTGDTGNNGWKGPVSAKATLSFTVPAAQVAADDAAGESVTVKTQRVVDGSTSRSFGLEWEVTSGTNRFRNALGAKVNGYSLSWSQGSFVEESASFDAQAPSKAAATIGTGGPTAALTTGFMNCVGDFGSLWIDEVASAIDFSQINLSLTNTHSPVRAVGTVGPSQIVQGKFDISLSGTAIYDDTAACDTLFGNIEDHDTIAVGWDVVDAQGNRIFFHIPAMKADEGQPMIGEPNSLVDFPLTLSGHDPAKDADSAYTSSSFGYQFGIYYVAA